MTIQIKKAIVPFALFALMLSGCAVLDGSRAYRHQTPTEYYLYPPDNYVPDGKWSLFIGLYGEGESSRDCYKQWQRYAEEYKFVLLCPKLVEEEGAFSIAGGEQTISRVLSEVYKQVVVDDRFFVAGYSAGGDFALAYAYRYPNAIVGVSVISAENFPQPSSQGIDLPVLITVGDRDDERVEAAQDFSEAMEARGFAARLVVLPGVGHQLSGDATRLTLDFFKQVTQRSALDY
jgi:pimeloyl-ACP methyl ester carboxylesterase